MPSAVIRDFAYDAVRNELTVSFTTGKVYVYSLVPKPIADAFAKAFSKGEFFNEQIRDRFPFRKTREASEREPGSLLDALKRSGESH